MRSATTCPVWSERAWIERAHMRNTTWERPLLRTQANASVSLFVDNWHTHNEVTDQQGPLYMLIKNHGCRSKDELLGHFPSVQECAEVPAPGAQSYVEWADPASHPRSRARPHPSAASSATATAAAGAKGGACGSSPALRGAPKASPTAHTISTRSSPLVKSVSTWSCGAASTGGGWGTLSAPRALCRMAEQTRRAPKH